ncbi:MAG: hypothetical protein IIA72_08680 [Proteobacteria bacterium]|nr:hypothetical protein [Pseudomonadota bacterium]
MKTRVVRLPTVDDSIEGLTPSDIVEQLGFGAFLVKARTSGKTMKDPVWFMALLIDRIAKGIRTGDPVPISHIPLSITVIQRPSTITEIKWGVKGSKGPQTYSLMFREPHWIRFYNAQQDGDQEALERFEEFFDKQLKQGGVSSTVVSVWCNGSVIFKLGAWLTGHESKAKS